MAVSTYEDCPCCGNCPLCFTVPDDLILRIDLGTVSCFCLYVGMLGYVEITLTYDTDLSAWVFEGDLTICADVACSTQTTVPISVIVRETCGFQGSIMLTIDDCFTYSSMHYVDDPESTTFCQDFVYTSSAHDIKDCCPDTDCDEEDTFEVIFTLAQVV